MVRRPQRWDVWLGAADPKDCSAAGRPIPSGTVSHTTRYPIRHGIPPGAVSLRHGIPSGMVSHATRYPIRHGIPYDTVSHPARYPIRHGIPPGTVSDRLVEVLLLVECFRLALACCVDYGHLRHQSQPQDRYRALPGSATTPQRAVGMGRCADESCAHSFHGVCQARPDFGVDSLRRAHGQKCNPDGRRATDDMRRPPERQRNMRRAPLARARQYSPRPSAVRVRAGGRAGGHDGRAIRFARLMHNNNAAAPQCIRVQ